MTEVTTADWNDPSGKLMRSALGKVGFIGELYDARNEMFCSRSLFTSAFPTNLIKTQQNSKCEIDYSHKDQLSNRFDLLKIEAELQLSILSGLFQVQGHGKYLSEEKKSERTVSCSLLYTLTTVCEKLMAAFSEIGQYIDVDVFKDEQYTHVVVEINWGANCTITLEHKSGDSSEKSKAEGMLVGELSKLGSFIKVRGEGTANYDKTNDEKFTKMNLKVHADVVPEGGIPNTVDKAVSFIAELPKLLKKVNDGRGTPLNYVMVPISTFKKLCNFDKVINAMIKSIDESFIFQIVCFFEKLASLKQKLYDLEIDVASHQKYLPSSHLTKIRDKQEEIKKNECVYKTTMAEDLPKIRAGIEPMKDLIMKLKDLETGGLNLVRIEIFIDEFKDIKSKINEIDSYLIRSINYLGKNENLDDLTMGNKTDNFYVLYTCKELIEKDKEISRKTLHYFLSEAKSPKPNTNYVVVDLSLNAESSIDFEKVTIVHYRNGIIRSPDVYKDFEEKSAMNFAKLVDSTDMDYVEDVSKPNNRVPVKLSCPAETCSDESLLWSCNDCYEYLEYGFHNNNKNNFFYCNCGRAPIQSYKLKCNSSNHGDEFILITCHSSLKAELEELTQLKEMNILILGQSGVGKSTWINSIINYLQYDTLEEAESGGVKCVIPASFTISRPTEDGVDSQEIKIGEDDPNENSTSGKSATRMPKTYNFKLRDRAVRLIDTPGLGDTEGYDRDKENMRNILDHIAHLKEIHGICILMKPNETRIDAIFNFCIKELITHLHQSAASNILFCFTNSRSSNYAPGDTLNLLKALIQASNLSKLIKLNKETIFCLENEAFRFLCTLNYKNINYSDEERRMYEASWVKSVTETKRLFERIKGLEPHLVADTTTLCNIRNRILTLRKPMADISKIIQLNLSLIEEKERSIKDSKLSLDELASSLYIPIIELEPEKLDYARTVCVSSKCVKYHQSKTVDVKFVEYATVCHDKCRVRNTTTETFPQPNLRYCQTFYWGGFYWLKNYNECKKCGCSWDQHMHINYIQKPVEKQVIDDDVKKKIDRKTDSKTKIEMAKNQLERDNKQYRDEQDTIMKIYLKFGLFLKQHAIAPFNDGLKDYLNLLIENEKWKVERSKVEDMLLKNLYETMRRYEEEVKILKDSMENGADSKKITPEDIDNLEKELYELKLTGHQIKISVETATTCNRENQEYVEQTLAIKNGSKAFGLKKQKSSFKNNKNSLPAGKEENLDADEKIEKKPQKDGYGRRIFNYAKSFIFDSDSDPNHSSANKKNS